MRTEVTIRINNELEIVELKEYVFKVEGDIVRLSGYAFLYPKRGYLSFKSDMGRPYTPLGGRQALQEILDQGGLLSFDDVVWVRCV